MNKFGLALGVAAVAAISGCKDPNYTRHGNNVQNAPQPVATQPTEQPVPVEVVAPEKDIQIVPEVQSCSCLPGTAHKEPCKCGAPDCKCVVEAPVPVVAPAPVEETTPYIVQRGDYLAKISKKYNITIAAIKRVNPKLNCDVIRVGQTIQLPGKVEVGEQKKPVVAPVVAPAKPFVPYTGATKEYKIQNGDSLGLIAKKNGISVRQLKELNGLSSDMIRAGRTLKVPAEKAAAPVAVAKQSEAKKPAAKPVEAAKPAVEAAAPAPAPAVSASVDEVSDLVKAAEEVPAVEPAAVEPAAKPAEEGPTHIVREGEDITSLSILFSLSPSEIRAFNNLGENEELKPGQVIKLPADTQL